MAFTRKDGDRWGLFMATWAYRRGGCLSSVPVRFFFGWIQTNCFIEGFVVKATIRDAFESFIVWSVPLYPHHPDQRGAPWPALGGRWLGGRQDPLEYLSKELKSKTEVQRNFLKNIEFGQPTLNWHHWQPITHNLVVGGVGKPGKHRLL